MDRPRIPFGFTLAELAVVVFLIGLFLSLTLPKFAGISSHEQLRHTTRRLTGMALQAYSEAIAKSRPWFLCFDLSDRRVWLSTVRPETPDDSARTSPFFDIPDGVKIKDIYNPSSGEVLEGLTAFGYWPQGGGEPGEIHLVASDGREMTIFLRPYLGRVEIKEGYIREATQ